MEWALGNQRGDIVVRQQKEQLPIALQLLVAKFQAAEWGDAPVAYVQLSAGADTTPLLEGLENDMCPALTGAM
jgi:hypothetical protein